MVALLANELEGLSDELFRGDLLVETYRLVDMNALKTVDYANRESLINAVCDIKRKHCASITDIRYNYDERSLAVVVLYDDTKLEDMSIRDIIPFLEFDAEYHLMIKNPKGKYEIECGYILTGTNPEFFHYLYPEPDNWGDCVVIGFLSNEAEEEFFTKVKIESIEDETIYLKLDPREWNLENWFETAEQSGRNMYYTKQWKQE